LTGQVPRRVVLIHGAATTSAVWQKMLPFLTRYEVIAPQRGYSGDLDTEIADITPLCHDAVLVGVSGGATLVLELAKRKVAFHAAVAHEPAAGSLCPRLLDHVIAGWQQGGVEGFGTALYGPSWSLAGAPAAETVERDLAMFRKFEPAPLPPGTSRLLLTTGSLSPAIRAESVAALSEMLPATVRTLPGVAHAVHLERPDLLAGLVDELSG
jgi:pimeloyl-ACP methyl ester carboxylesterase